MQMLLLLTVLLCSGTAFACNRCRQTFSPCTCDLGAPVCENGYTTLNWTCPPGEKPAAMATWGRTAEDDQTCVDNVNPKKFSGPECPGNNNMAALAVEEWCDKHVDDDGVCKLKASPSHLTINGVKYDPCTGTSKILEVCSLCIANWCETACEGKKMTFPWTCPEGETRELNVFWGREPGDDQTCVEKRNPNTLIDLDCPGDDDVATQIVEQWCNNTKNVDTNGDCTITASTKDLKVDGVGYDPCPGTAKYLRVCSYCSTGFYWFG